MEQTQPKVEQSQQEFLRDAMSQLGYTRMQLAQRICPPGGETRTKRRIDNWLLPSESKEFRKMDEIVWMYIREILAAEKTGKPGQSS